MADGSTGIHHITAIAGDPQANLDFYAGVLGLRFVKRTVNFDDPGTYHFYYGDETGSPGSILTFFPWGGDTQQGRPGVGQATVISFSVPTGALTFWQERLAALGIEYAGPKERFGEQVIALRDPDGISLELVAASEDRRKGFAASAIPEDAAVRGFHSVLLAEEGYERTAELLAYPLGFRKVREEDTRVRFESGAGGPGSYVDISCLPTGQHGLMGVGAVHHVAFRASNDEEQGELRQQLLKAGANVTPVLDRQYFHSIYFREPGGVLFEVATDNPGFLWDEPVESLGESLKLPHWYEEQRQLLEKVLPSITVPSPYSAEKRV